MTPGVFLRQLRHHWPLLVAVLAAAALFELAVVSLIAVMDSGAGLRTLLSSILPPAMQRLVFEQFGIGSFQGAVAFGFQHPIALIAAFSLVIVVATAPAAERESGLLDLLLARPLPRARYLAASLAMVVVAAVLIPLAMLAAAALGMRLVEATDELPWTRYVPSAAALAPLLLVVGGYTLLIASQARRRGSAVAWAVGLSIVSYWIDFFAPFWDALGTVRWASPFSYYDPVRAAVGAGIGLRDPLVLLAAAAVLIALAFFNFQRQDL